MLSVARGVWLWLVGPSDVRVLRAQVNWQTGKISELNSEMQEECRQHDAALQLAGELHAEMASFLKEANERAASFERQLDIERSKVQVLESQNKLLWVWQEREMARVYAETAKLHRERSDAEAGPVFPTEDTEE